jgi:L-alanine-DL-glutamate epimerase-like enolase superfamily enzyme
LCQECEKNIEAVQDDMKHEESRHNWTQTTFNNGVKVENSFVTLPDLPGIGFEGKADLYREMKALAS